MSNTPNNPEKATSNMDNQSAITQDFEKNWSIITDAFKVQKEKGLFPFSYSSSTEGDQLITEESFQKTLDLLHDEKFTIAVCGVVKAGKSTFLNSLLFGRDILPAFDTPMTAKLTFIEYTDKANYATITFYSKEEWAQLNNDLKEKFPPTSHGRRDEPPLLQLCRFLLRMSHLLSQTRFT